MRSGFVAVVGRPNVGKSTLVNRLVGEKVSIVSSRPNTTRHGVRGVVHLDGAQVVLVDTPGFHRPRTALGERLVETAGGSVLDADAAVVVVDATAPVGPGDRAALSRVLAHLGPERAGAEPPLLVAVNKVDRARRPDVLERLAEAARAVEELGPAPGAEFFPISAKTGEGVEPLLATLVERLPEGPPFYPEGTVSDMPEAQHVAELVREQLLRHAREELPHSIACRVTDWEWPVIRCEILVERDSQKGIVIGKGGQVLKAVGSAVREALPPGAYIELRVRVERRWQQRPDVLDRLGY